MLAPPRSRYLFASLAIAALVSSCDTQTEATFTIPAPGSTGVKPRSIVAVILNNSITEIDVNSLNVENFVVTGDLTAGRYTGTLSLAPSSILRQSLTVEEYATELAKVEAEAPKNSIVFSLPAATSFKDGELISVHVSERVTSHQSPIDESVNFAFRIAETSVSADALTVTSTSPAGSAVGVALRPDVRTAFSRAAKADAFADGIKVRGSQSGLHTGLVNLATRTDSSGALEVLTRLASADSFLPGEDVQVTYGATIGAAGSGSDLPKLSPFLLGFQATSGAVSEGWTSAGLASGLAGPRAVLAADLSADHDGAELVVVDAESIEHLEVTDGSVSRRERTEISLAGTADPPTGPFHVVDAVVCDFASDGVPDVVVVLGSATGSRLAVYAVGDAGTLEASGDPVDFPATGILQAAVGDLDSNGEPELLVIHPDRTYVPTGQTAAKSTGTATLFDIQMVSPDPASIDIGDPDSLLPKPKFVAVETPLSRAPAATRMGLADLDSNGRLDVVLETASGIVFYKLTPIGTTDPWFYRKATGQLLGRDGGSLAPLAWTCADVDSDGDVDILAWDSTGPLLYRNELRSSGGGSALDLLADVTQPEELPEASRDIVLVGPGAVIAAEVDGDGLLDLIILPGDGEASIRLQRSDAPLTFDAVPLPAAGPIPSIALADVDGDSGLDIAILVSGEGESSLAAFLSSGVEPPPVDDASSFAFADEASGLSDLDGTDMRLAVIGNLARTFSGYSIALEYDETVLEYRGFEIPEVLSRKASFTLCPDASLQGCSGRATAKMAYLQNAKGSPVQGLLLGTFLFKRREVSTAGDTVIELEDFTGTGNAVYANTLKVVDGAASYDEAVDVEAAVVSISLEPPAPADLAATCSVLDRGDASLTGRVAWESPSGVVFRDFVVSVAGADPVTVPGNRFSQDFTTAATGAIAVSVEGTTQAGKAAKATCQVVGVHRPIVTCEALTAAQNRVSWTLEHAADSFLVYRNGVYIATKDGSATTHLDAAASTTGADNYLVAAVVAGVEGPRGTCKDGPVGDPEPGETLAPIISEARRLPRSEPSDPNQIRLRWTNSEGYDQISLTLRDDFAGSTVLSRTLPGGDTEFVYSGEASLGGVPPGRYVFTIAGSVRGQASEVVTSQAVSVPIPPLEATLTCGVAPTGDVEVSWTDIWRGYTKLELVVEHRIEDIPIGAPVRYTLALTDRSYTLTGLEATGTYLVSLQASYDDPVPPEATVNPALLVASCKQPISYSSRIYLEDVECGVGLDGFAIPVRARIHGVVEGYAFELDVPSFLEIDEATAIVPERAGASTTIQLDVSSGGTPDRKRLTVRVDGVSIPADWNSDGVVDDDDEPVLARILASVPEDFGLAGQSPLVFGSSSTMRFAEGGDVPVPADGAKLLVRKRFLRIDEKTIAVGSQETVVLSSWATFNAPQGAPNYRINAFQLHIVWDPKVLDLQPVLEADQQDTAIAGLGWLVLPTADTYTTSRATGHLKVSWLGFRLTNPSQPDYLYPGINLKILNMRFRSLVPGTGPATFAEVRYVTDPSDQLPTAFFPEVDVPSEPDMEAFLPGGVRMTSGAVGFGLQAIQPAKGAHAGGGEATISGTGLVATGGGTQGVSVVLKIDVGDGSTATVPVETILSADPSRIRIRMPPSGIPDPAILSMPADVEVTTPTGSGRLLRAYSYEFPRLSGSDLTRIRSAGGELLVLRGEGLPILSEVVFRVVGEAGQYPAQVSGVEPDGTRVYVVTPALVGKEGKRASVDVKVEGFDTLVLPSTLEIYAGGGEPTLRIDSVSPSSGSICGGDVVTIAGSGFLPGLTVRFGSIPAASVEVLGGTSARATTPAVPEGTARVSVTVANPTGTPATKADAFLFEPAAPAFIRGDMDDDGTVNVNDGLSLSALVLGKPEAVIPENLDAADSNDDGVIGGGDVIYLMNYLFAGGSAPPAPFPAAGADPTPDSITSCES